MGCSRCEWILYISCNNNKFIGKFDCSGNQVDADPSTPEWITLLMISLDDFFRLIMYSMLMRPMLLQVIHLKCMHMTYVQRFNLMSSISCWLGIVYWARMGIGILDWRCNKIQSGSLDISTFAIPCNTSVIENPWMDATRS